MLFCSVELARRIERAECELIEDGTRALERAGEAVGLWPLGGGLAAFSGAHSPLTKLVGLGFDGPPEARALEAVEAAFAQRGAPLTVELATLAEAGWSEFLTRRGYHLVGFENVLGCALDARPTPPAHPELELTLAAPDEHELWLDVVVESFATPDAQGVAAHETFPREPLRRVVAAFSAARGMRTYLARRAGEPAAGASLRLAGPIAQMCGAGTLPTHRRRGLQAALFERRLADAARAGCTLALCTTLPGSKSQENARRQGFELLYTRALLRKDP